MYKTSKTMRRMCVLAGILVLGVTANAIPFDTHISIDRALNSPTLTIRYTGAHAALVELRVNGESMGTRSMSSTKDTGETNFNITLTDLKDGDNDVEVRLYDRTGKLVATEKTNISTDQSTQGPVYLSVPKVGATVRGPVEIKLAFSREIKNSIASFFVDGNFKSMSNYPPYSYVWDTLRETNGWHEVEAWDVDESSQTYKTRKTRVFVDNPGGPTNRPGVNNDLSPTSPTIRASANGADAAAKNGNVGGASQPTFKPAGIEPKMQMHTETSSNPIQVMALGGASSLQPAPHGTSIATGVRYLAPTGKHMAPVTSKVNAGVIHIDVHSGTDRVTLKAEPSANQGKSNAVLGVPTEHAPSRSGLVAMRQAPSKQVLSDVASAAHMLTITRGQRVPNIGQFAIELNSQFVRFDVQPRVDDGVPMTPLRYLLEKGGGKVDWENMTKTVKATADGKSIVIQIGDRNATVDQVTVSMEVTPYLDHGRTIVPLSFLHDALGVNVEYDKETGHVLITSAK